MSKRIACFSLLLVACAASPPVLGGAPPRRSTPGVELVLGKLGSLPNMWWSTDGGLLSAEAYFGDPEKGPCEAGIRWARALAREAGETFTCADYGCSAGDADSTVNGTAAGRLALNTFLGGCGVHVEVRSQTADVLSACRDRIAPAFREVVDEAGPLLGCNIGMHEGEEWQGVTIQERRGWRVVQPRLSLGWMLGPHQLEPSGVATWRITRVRQPS
jgi:hypothetical protein